MVGILNFVEVEEGREYADDRQSLDENHTEAHPNAHDFENMDEMKMCYGDCFGL